jgi:predicted transcriptional regulator
MKISASLEYKSSTKAENVTIVTVQQINPWSLEREQFAAVYVDSLVQMIVLGHFKIKLVYITLEVPLKNFPSTAAEV